MKKTTATVALLCLCLAAAPARANPLANVGKAYATAHNLPYKELTFQRGNQQVKRMIVPFTNDAQLTDLVGRCSGKACVVRMGRDKNHPCLVMGNKHMRHFQAGWQNGTGPYNAMQRGCVVAISMDNQTFANTQSYLTKWHPTADWNAWKTHYGNIASSDCMHWLRGAHVNAVNPQTGAPVGKALPLAHYAGVSRSKSSANMIARMRHQGNERVGLIGVFAQDANAFNAMNDGALRGPPPQGNSTLH